MGFSSINQNTSGRQARASIYSLGGPAFSEGPILQNRSQISSSKKILGEVLDVDFKPVEKIEERSRNDAKQQRLASQARSAKIFLSNTRPGTLLSEDKFDAAEKSSSKASAPDSLSEWKAAIEKTGPEAITERLSNLEAQVAELRQLIGGKAVNQDASIYERRTPPELVANPDTRYMASEKQYSGFIPNGRTNTRTLEQAA